MLACSRLHAWHAPTVSSQPLRSRRLLCARCFQAKAETPYLAPTERARPLLRLETVGCAFVSLWINGLLPPPAQDVVAMMKLMDDDELRSWVIKKMFQPDYVPLIPGAPPARFRAD